MSEIALIVIDYKKPQLVKSLVASASGLEARERVQILVVENEANEAIRRTVEELEGPGVRALFEDRNWGYFGGAQVGLEWLDSQSWKPEWIIVSNSDIEFPQREFFRKLLDYRVPADLGVLAPGILSGLSMDDQNPFYVSRPASWRMHFYKWCFRWYATGAAYGMAGVAKDYLKGKLGGDGSHAPTPRSAGEIYAPHGAFIIFHRNYFERGGSFKHGAFLFNEEFTVAETCRETGLKVVYEPGLQVRHADHATMGSFPSRNVIKFHGEASRFTADRYFS